MSEAVHITLEPPPLGQQRGLREWLLIAARPLWPLMRRGLALQRPGAPGRVRNIKSGFAMTFAAVNRGDFLLVEGHYTPDCELVIDPDSVLQLDLAASYRGREGIRQIMASWDDAFREWGWQVTDMVDQRDRWVGLGELIGTGGVSGIAVRSRIGIVTDMRKGRIWRQHYFWKWEDALAHAGLPPLDQIPKA